MLLAVPEEGARKPPVLGFGCRLGSGILSCEALFVEKHIPDGVLEAHLYGDADTPPRIVRLDWSAVEPALYKHAVIDLWREP